MTNCKDCKHWGERNATGFMLWKFGATRTVKTDHGECAQAEDPMDSGEIRPMMLHGPDNARLYTAPDFGCALGEPK